MRSIRYFFLLICFCAVSASGMLYAQSVLDSRGDFPRNRYFTINSDRYYLGTDEFEIFRSSAANRIILRGMYAYRGNLAGNQSKFKTDNKFTGYSLHIKHRYSGFMLGLETLGDSVSIPKATDGHPNADKLAYTTRSLYIHYLYEFGFLGAFQTNIALGAGYGQGRVKCNSARCRNVYPDRGSAPGEIISGTFHIGFHFSFLEFVTGVGYFSKKDLELKSADSATDTLKFPFGGEVYYVGGSIRL